MQLKAVALLSLALFVGYLIGTFGGNLGGGERLYTNITVPAFACPEVELVKAPKEVFLYVDDEDLEGIGRAEATPRQDPFAELGRQDQFLIDYVAGKRSPSTNVFLEFGTGDGVGTLALSRHANENTKILSFDVADMRHGFIKEQWGAMALSKSVSFHLLDASGDLQEQIHDILRQEALFAATPAIVVVNPRWEQSTRSAVLQLGGAAFSTVGLLRDELSHLQHDTAVLMDPILYIKLLQDSEQDSVTASGDGTLEEAHSLLLPFRYDDDLTNIREQLDATLTVVRLVHPGLSPPFDESLLPPGSTLEQADLQPSRAVTPGDWVVFMRIPKCGTKSMVDLLKKHTKAQRGCSGSFLTSPHMQSSCHIVSLCSTDSSRIFDIQLGKCQLIEAHHCDWADLVPTAEEKAAKHGVDTRIVTIVRDPVRRVVSEYKHTYGKPKAWDYCPSKNGAPAFSRENFIAHIQDEANAWGMRNRQTRMLAGCGTVDECTDTDEELLNRAKRHLLACDIVGLTSRFPETVMLMQYVFGWTIPRYNIMLEAADIKTLDWDIDDEVADMIRRYNHLDVQLFEFATALMDRRLEQLRDILQVPKLPEYECPPNGHICTVSDPYHINWQSLWEILF